MPLWVDIASQVSVAGMVAGLSLDMTRWLRVGSIQARGDWQHTPGSEVGDGYIHRLESVSLVYMTQILAYNPQFGRAQEPGWA